MIENWDASWVLMIKSLSVYDYAVLRRQWLHKSAILLVRAELMGPGSEAYNSLTHLSKQHASLVAAMIRFNPEVWLNMLSVEMEGLQKIEPPSHEMYVYVYVCIYASIHPPI
jgi:hypothetical protein